MNEKQQEKTAPVDGLVRPKFEREQRYIVIKISDLKTMPRSQAEIDELDHILFSIASHREIVLGKKPMDCLVVESDWPEYEPTWKAIEERMTKV